MVLYGLDNDKSADLANLVSRPSFYWKIEAGLDYDFGYNFERTRLTGQDLAFWLKNHPNEMPECVECIYAFGNTPEEALAKIIRGRLDNEMYLGDLYIGRNKES